MPGFFKSIGNFFTGTPEKRENISTLLPGQERTLNQLNNAIQGRGSSGAFGDVSNYYRGNLSNNPQDFDAFAAPSLRQYNEDIVPGISEQFAGFGGSGSLNSSGFRNAQIQGATDLSERLGALRASLRQQSAQGLQNLGQLGLGNYSQNMVTKPGSEGFLSSVAPAIGTAAGAAIGGPFGAAIGAGAGNLFSNAFGGNKVGRNTSAYGSEGPQASPRFGSQLPNFSFGR
jgi:hypothetical protein